MEGRNVPFDAITTTVNGLMEYLATLQPPIVASESDIEVRVTPFPGSSIGMPELDETVEILAEYTGQGAVPEDPNMPDPTLPTAPQPVYRLRLVVPGESK